MENSLLICIAFYFVEEKYKYLKAILTRFKTYQVPIHIIIDTNSNETFKILDFDFHVEIQSKIIEIYVHNLEDPLLLSWEHRKHMIDKIDEYDFFMYTEDDMDLPYENYQDYLEKFSYLWPNYVPSFTQFEEKDGELYNVGNTIVNIFDKEDIIVINGKSFVNLTNEYYAFFIIPKKILKENLLFFHLTQGIPYSSIVWTSNFQAEAAFIWLNLGKKGLVELTKEYKVSLLCLAHHLPNKYVNMEDSVYGKLKMNEFIKIKD